MHLKRPTQDFDALGLVIGLLLIYHMCITITSIHMIINIVITDIIRCVIHLEVVHLLGQVIIGRLRYPYVYYYYIY